MSIKKLLPNSYFPVSPELVDSLQRYLDAKIPTGSFLQCVLEGDLFGAFGRADINNSANMANIVGYIYNELPSVCYGSKAQVHAWLYAPKEGGL